MTSVQRRQVYYLEFSQTIRCGQMTRYFVLHLYFSSKYLHVVKTHRKSTENSYSPSWKLQMFLKDCDVCSEGFCSCITENMSNFSSVWLTGKTTRSHNAFLILVLSLHTGDRWSCLLSFYGDLAASWTHSCTHCGLETGLKQHLKLAACLQDRGPRWALT